MGRPTVLISRRLPHSAQGDAGCVILATHELDETPLPPQELLHGSKGQSHAARGFRFRKAPSFLLVLPDG